MASDRGGELSIKSGPALRGLVVDDDPAVRELVVRLLLDLGIEAQVAADGREAEQWLRNTPFDLLFLDVDLPYVTGDQLLELIRQNVLPRPAAIVMMSADEALRSAPADHWLRRGVMGFLAKPLSRDQICAFVEAARAVRAGEGAVVEPGVLVAGSGLWADALTRVVFRGGGKLVEAHGPDDVPGVIRRERPHVAVFGPPIPAQDLLHVVGTIRSTPDIAGIPIFIGLPRTDPRLVEELKMLGASSIYVLPSGINKLSADVIMGAVLNTRTFRRAPLAAPVRLQSTSVTLDGFARDLSEGGMGLVQFRAKPPSENLNVEFALPGESDPVRAATQLAWTRPDGDSFQVGLRFTLLEETDRERIRRYVDARAAAMRSP